MANEINDSFKSASCEQNGICSLGEYAMARPDQQLAKFDSQASNSKLMDAGILPQMSFNLADTDSDPVIELKKPVGENVATKDMKEHGISARKYEDNPDDKKTVVENDKGVKVTVTEGKDGVTASGRKIHHDDTVQVESTNKNLKLHEDQKRPGHWVDQDGREWAHRNNDGSVTVDSGEGTFVKQDSHSVKPTSAYRDGKQFKDMDTFNPIGEELRKEMMH